LLTFINSLGEHGAHSEKGGGAALWPVVCMTLHLVARRRNLLVARGDGANDRVNSLRQALAQ
jgi:hypothetical protein